MPQVESIDLDACSATPASDSTLEDFAVAMAYAAAMRRHSAWWLGDMLLELDRRWGDKGAQAFPMTMLTISDLERLRAVSSKVPLENRNANLSWTHHNEVSRLPVNVQSQALSLCELRGWNCADFRAYVTKVLGNRFLLERLRDG